MASEDKGDPIDNPMNYWPPLPMDQLMDDALKMMEEGWAREEKAFQNWMNEHAIPQQIALARGQRPAVITIPTQELQKYADLRNDIVRSLREHEGHK